MTQLRTMSSLQPSRRTSLLLASPARCYLWPAQRTAGPAPLWEAGSQLHALLQALSRTCMWMHSGLTQNTGLLSVPHLQDSMCNAELTVGVPALQGDMCSSMLALLVG